MSDAELSVRDLAVLVRVLAWTEADADVTLAGKEVIGGRAHDVLAIVPRTAESGQ